MVQCLDCGEASDDSVALLLAFGSEKSAPLFFVDLLLASKTGRGDHALRGNGDFGLGGSALLLSEQ